MTTQHMYLVRTALRLLGVCGLAVALAVPPAAPAQTAGPGLIISEFLANPAGNDSPLEYVELVATKSIDFAATPYSVVFANNGIATANGWITGGTVTYGFSITSGSVKAGDVVYVGGSGMQPTGSKLRTINTATTQGDRFGAPELTGVLGNGGQQADGIAVFAAEIGTLTRDTVPVDALFFGTAAGTAVVGGGTAGYQLPVNDLYTGGKLRATSFLAPDPGSTQVVVANGAYDAGSGTFTRPRTWAVAPASDGTSGVVVTLPPANEPIVRNCANALFAIDDSPVSTVVSATDPDGTVGVPQLVSEPVAGITLSEATGASAVGGTASVKINLATNAAPGIHPVTVRFSNSDTPPEVVECTLAVGVVVVTDRVYLPTVSKP